MDRNRRPGQFLLTGSTDLLRLPGLGDSLAEQAGLPPSSITAYLDVLAGVFAIEQLEPWSPEPDLT
ncbi:MAG: hypothetical protein Q4D96_14655 [Propionibacteriaceae bacterium]|nr:hypothetical protein [Propionibacteriaceae bacterium]